MLGTLFLYSIVNVCVSETFHNVPKHPLILLLSIVNKKLVFSVPLHGLESFFKVVNFGVDKHCS